MIGRYIQVFDDVYPDTSFKTIKSIADSMKFKTENHGGKDFTINKDEIFNSIMHDGVEQCLRHTVTLHLAFTRLATQDIDTDLRIHSDFTTPGNFASVFYVDVEKWAGTRFYHHEDYGFKLPKDTPSEEADKVLMQDSENLCKFSEDITVKARPNRMLLYQSDLFHSKLPKRTTSKPWKRVVWVGFWDFELNGKWEDK